jgi:hypothetical protein
MVSPGLPDIAAQKVSAVGATQWGLSGIAVTSTNMNSEGHPAMITDGAGGVIMIWFQGTSGVRAQRLSAAGSPQWGSVILATLSNNMQPSIAADGMGGAVFGFSAGGAVYAHRVNSAGTRLWTPAQGGVQLSSSGKPDSDHLDGAGGATVAWQDFRTGTNYNIYAQRLSSTGAPQWMGNGVPVSNVQDDQLTPGIVSDGGTGAIISWTDRRMIASGFDIYAERVDATGASLWTPDGAPVCKQPNDQDAPVITTAAAGGAWVAWQDQRSGNSDIYIDRLASNGSTLSVPTPDASVAARAWPNPFTSDVQLSFALPARGTREHGRVRSGRAQGAQPRQRLTRSGSAHPAMGWSHRRRPPHAGRRLPAARQWLGCRAFAIGGSTPLAPRRAIFAPPRSCRP